MSPADQLFLTSIERVWAAMPATRFEIAARWGPIGCDLIFTDKALSEEYSRAMLPAAGLISTCSIAVMTGADIDLSNVIPIDNRRGRSYFSERFTVSWHYEANPVLWMLDRHSRLGVVWLPTGSAPDWELSRPACSLLQGMLSDTSWSGVHGAAIGRSGRMLFLAGKGRTGKSTAALSCLREGWDYAGDDYICINSETGRIEPLYGSARLRIDMEGAFPDLLHTSASLSSYEGDQRHELRLNGHIDPNQLKGGQIAAILISRRRGAKSPEFEPARRADALQAILVETTHGMPGPPRVTAHKLSRLVRLAPTFYVDTGNDPTAIPDAFRAFLARV